MTASNEGRSGKRLGQFGLAFAFLGILIGGGMLAVILVWLHALSNLDGFD